jgi:Na+/melibiose symporter-like transporter
MIEILIMLIPSILMLIALVLFLDLYLLVRKYLKLKIEKLKKEN